MRLTKSDVHELMLRLMDELCGQEKEFYEVSVCGTLIKEE